MMENHNITPPAVSIYNHGIVLVKSKVRIVLGKSESLQKRGKITSFSVKSAARLRKVLLTHDIPGSRKIGWTLTLPWSDDLFVEGGRGLTEFRRLVHLLGVNYHTSRPRSGVIYRIELQQRGAPHLHAIEYVAEGDEPHLGNLWRRGVLRSELTSDDSVAAFCRHGVRSDHLHGVDNVGYLRYLADHASKHKALQLGWQGKQWGIVNKAAFAVERGDFERLSEREYALFVRYFQRVNRYPVTIDGKVVKYRRNRRANGASFLRGGSATAARLLALARINANAQPLPTNCPN